MGPPDVEAEAAIHNPSPSRTLTLTGDACQSIWSKKNGWRAPHAGQPNLPFVSRGRACYAPENEPRLPGERYAVNELPHPPLPVACRSWKTNPPPPRPSLQPTLVLCGQ